MGLKKDFALVLASLGGGAIACGVSAYMIIFVMNFPTPYISVPTIDGNPFCSPLGHIWPSSPLANNVLLITIFMLQHSFMVRGPARRVLDLCLSEDGVRVAYVYAAGASLLSMFVFWSPMPYQIWDVQHSQLRIIITAVNIICWFGLAYSLAILDPFTLFGIKPLVEKLLKWKREVNFVTSNVYALVRHPACTFMYMAFWITPSMTVGHILFSSLMTLYSMLAVAYFEEADLIRLIGQPYVDYMKTTPRYVPTLCPVKRTKKKLIN